MLADKLSFLHFPIAINGFVVINLLVQLHARTLWVAKSDLIKNRLNSGVFLWNNGYARNQRGVAGGGG